MTALDDAAQAVEDARATAFHEKTLPSLDRLIRAVRHHDAETVLAGKGVYYPTSNLGGDGWIADAAANLIRPEATP